MRLTVFWEAVPMELRRVAPVVGLVALLAADAVLIAWAFRPAPVDDYVPAAVRPSTSVSGSATGSGEATPTSTATAATVEVAPVEQFITAVGPRVAWVARAGSCANPSGVWVTDDQGSTWTRNPLPARILRLRATSATDAFGTGGKDPGCALRLWTTTDAGAGWGVPGDPKDAWSRMPEDATSVHTPTDQVVQPCGPADVIDLATLDGRRAQVLCADGAVRATSDGGERWPKAFTLDGALALTLVEGGGGAVVRAEQSCAGVKVYPLDSGRPEGDGACVVAPAARGRISISSASGSWWLLVGQRVFTAEDPLGPWNRTRTDAAG